MPGEYPPPATWSLSRFRVKQYIYSISAPSPQATNGYSANSCTYCSHAIYYSIMSRAYTNGTDAHDGGSA